MKDRIHKLLLEEKMTAAKFAEEIGIQASSISHFLSGRNKPSTDIIVKILNRFRGINAEWLLTGRGNMYKDDNSTTANSIISDKKTPEKSSPGDLFGSEMRFEEKKPEISELDEKPAENVENTQNSEQKNEEEDKNTTFKSPSPIPQNFQDKQIKKIVIFYSDNTFEHYSRE